MPPLIVIPARAHSQRFFNKPLARLLGVTLVERAFRIATAVPGVGRVVVATDAQPIVDHVRGFGGEAVLTAPAKNGSERAALVAAAMDASPDVVVNLQGDAPLTPPAAIAAVIARIREGAQAATAAVPLSGAALRDYVALKGTGRVSGTTVVMDRQDRALYFSKAVLPKIRHAPAGGPVIWRHLGLYAFTFEAILRYRALPPTPLEEAEGLEQLRWLEHGHDLAVVRLPEGAPIWSIDYPEDLAVAENMLTMGAP